MTIKEAMRQRHTVRKYTDEPIAPELVEKLTRMEGILKVTYLNQEKK